MRLQGEVASVATELRAAVAQLGGDADARIDAEVLLAFVLECDRGWLIAHRDDDMLATLRHAYAWLIDQRAQGHPVAYLIGRRGFWNLELEVAPGVLIPRPETELLVQLALDRMPVERAMRIADLGTGSGAIALALASERPQVTIVAIDASVEALRIAEANARRLGLGNVRFLRGDWLDALRADGSFDVIVTNPPYLSDSDAHLLQGDLRFEPRMALASGADGLDAIRTIVRSARARLRRGGQLLIEHGATQGAEVRGLLAEAGYRDVTTWRDLNAHERVSGGVLAD